MRNLLENSRKQVWHKLYDRELESKALKLNNECLTYAKQEGAIDGSQGIPHRTKDGFAPSFAVGKVKSQYNQLITSVKSKKVQREGYHQAHPLLQSATGVSEDKDDLLKTLTPKEQKAVQETLVQKRKHKKEKTDELKRKKNDHVAEMAKLRTKIEGIPFKRSWSSYLYYLAAFLLACFEIPINFGTILMVTDTMSIALVGFIALGIGIGCGIVADLIGTTLRKSHERGEKLHPGFYLCTVGLVCLFLFIYIQRAHAGDADGALLNIFFVCLAIGLAYAHADPFQNEKNTYFRAHDECTAIDKQMKVLGEEFLQIEKEIGLAQEGFCLVNSKSLSRSERGYEETLGLREQIAPYYDELIARLKHGCQECIDAYFNENQKARARNGHPQLEKVETD